MAKRNGKTKPAQARQSRVFGETDADDSFVPPDRVDQVSLSEADGRPGEVIDFRTGDTDVDLPPDNDADAGGDGGGTDADDVVPLRERPRPQQQAREPGTQRQARGGEDAGLSRSVQKRVARERAIANRERTLREQTQKQLNDERVARQATDDRLLRLERTQKQLDTNGDLKALKAQMESLAPQIAAATEAGKTAEALALQIKLGDLQSKIAVMEYDIKLRSENAQAIEAQEAERRRVAAAAPAGGDTSQQVHPAQMAENIERGNEFKRANRHWWRKNPQARDASVEIDKEILQDIRDGTLELEPYSEEHFDEMASRLHEDFPDLELCDLEGNAYEFDDDDQQDQGRGKTRQEARVQQNNGRRGNGNGRPPQGRDGSVRGARQMDQVEMARRGQVQLTPEDFRTMRTFKLDPNNPEHKKQFAKERARTILREAQQGAN